jgi:hypothetical protein
MLKEKTFHSRAEVERLGLCPSALTSHSVVHSTIVQGRRCNETVEVYYSIPEKAQRKQKSTP